MKKVLIAVIKNKRDMGILLNEKWYRIPCKYAPQKEFHIIAFYQPACFKEAGKRIEYYGIIKSYKICNRKTLIDDGIRADEKYYKISFSRINKLKSPIVNTNRMRISFKYTDFKTLKNSKTINELFNIPDIENRIERLLKYMKLKYKREYRIKMKNNKIYRLDFAVFSNNKKINIECDGEKWHSIKSQKLADKKRDNELQKDNWIILRLKEKEILNNIALCKRKIKKLLK